MIKRQKETVQIDFRQLQPSDSGRYKKIRLEGLQNYPEYFGDSYAEEANADLQKFDDTFFAHNDHSFLFGAFAEASMVGICGFIQQARIKTRHRGDLVQVYTDPLYGGQGIGRHLIKLTIDKTFANSAIDQILLNVVYLNDRAIGMYKRFGFCEFGMIDNYFKLGENSWSQVFMALTRERYLDANNYTGELTGPTVRPFDKLI